jgi:hypothetical protein
MDLTFGLVVYGCVIAHEKYIFLDIIYACILVFVEFGLRMQVLSQLPWFEFEKP